MLHGEIKVNGGMIGSWSARRLEKVVDPEGEHTYTCRVTSGDPLIEHHFMLKHRYSDGAAALASKVLAQAP